MTDIREENSSARLFVALELPAPVRGSIRRWGDAALRDPALRRVPEDALHMTLVFLGATPVGRIPEIAAVLLRLDAPAPLISFAPEPAPLPRGRRPGAYALEARSEGAEEVQARIEATLAGAGLHRPERRPFFPHVTVARVRKEPGRRRPAKVAAPPARIPEELSRPFRAVRIALYLSSFRPGGVHYAPLAQVELPAGEAAVR